MATFCVLVLPLPFAVRKRMFAFLNKNVIVAKVGAPWAKTTHHCCTYLSPEARLWIKNCVHVSFCIAVAGLPPHATLCRFVGILFVGMC